VRDAYQTVLNDPMKLLQLLVDGYDTETTGVEEVLAVELWHDVALVALNKEWKASKRLMVNRDNNILVGTMKTFSTSHFAWSLVLFKYWTKDADLEALQDVQEEDGGDANSSKSGSGNNNNNNGRGVLESQQDNQQDNQSNKTAGKPVGKRKPVKVCVGKSQQSMFNDYKFIRRKLNGTDNTGIDISQLPEGMKSWDLYMGRHDIETIRRKRGHSGQENVDPGDVYVPPTMPALTGTGGADNDLNFNVDLQASSSSSSSSTIQSDNGEEVQV